MTNRQIVYSKRVMTELLVRGFSPIMEVPNPTYPQYNCWIYERSEDFDAVFADLIRGSGNG